MGGVLLKNGLDVFFGGDFVAVALFGEEELAFDGEVLVAGVAGDEGVEACEDAFVGFGAEDATEALGFFLS